MDTILRHCYVMSPEEYSKSSHEGDDVFLCGHEYDFRHQTFKRIADAFDHVNLSFIFFFLLFLQFIPLFDVVNVEANLLHTCRKKATLCVISCCFCCICNYLPVSISLDGCLVEKPCLIFFSN